MKRILIGLVALFALAGAQSAQAQVVNQFNFQIKDIKKYGRFTVVFSSRSYDTTGAVPPLLTRSYIRLPAGAKFRKEFLKKANRKRLCDYETLHTAKNTSVCRRARIGGGTGKGDARLIINPLTGQSYVSDLLPYNVNLYLAKPQEKGAVASFLILAEPDLASGLFTNTGILESTKVVLTANFFNDPTADGKYGYRLEVPAGPPVEGLRVSVAEVNVVTKGMTLTKKKRTCAKRRRGRCVKRKVKKERLFWFTQPKCPASKQLPFQSFYQYEGLPTPQTVEITLPCPNFKR